MTPEHLARQFHETYERLAPSFGYETRTDTRAFDPESANGRLMIAVCKALLASAPAERWSTDNLEIPPERLRTDAIDIDRYERQMEHASGVRLSPPDSAREPYPSAPAEPTTDGRGMPCALGTCFDPEECRTVCNGYPSSVKPRERRKPERDAATRRADDACPFCGSVDVRPMLTTYCGKCEAHWVTPQQQRNQPAAPDSAATTVRRAPDSLSCWCLGAHMGEHDDNCPLMLDPKE